MTTSSQPALSRLAQATAPAHRRVEEAVRVLFPCERASYARYLARLFGFYDPFEPLLEHALGDVPELDLRARRKAPLLQADLRWLDVDSRILPRCADLPPLSTRARAFGGFYVVEGATLGGRIQLRLLGDSLRVSSSAGASFLGSYGPEVDARWQAARTAIAAQADQAGAMDEILDGAATTFDAFDRWLRT